MTHRERLLAVLDSRPYDRLPIVHFGFLDRTLYRWRDEGHLSDEEVRGALHGDGSAGEQAVAEKLGFDFNYHTIFGVNHRLSPGFEPKLIETLPDG
jgi:hypothetical protein